MNSSFFAYCAISAVNLFVLVFKEPAQPGPEHAVILRRSRLRLRRKFAQVRLPPQLLDPLLLVVACATEEDHEVAGGLLGAMWVVRGLESLDASDEPL